MKRTREGAAALAAVVMCVLAAMLPSAAGAKAPAATSSLTINVLSNRADLISGGDALVQIVVPSGVDPASVRVDVDGRDVTSAFAVRSDGRFLGRVESLTLGPNVLTAKLRRTHGARVTITNHSHGGPVFSGPQIQPWTCFAGRIRRQCNRQVQYEFFYQPTAGGGFRRTTRRTRPPTSPRRRPTRDRRCRSSSAKRPARRPRRVPDRRAVRPGAAVRPWAPQPGLQPQAGHHPRRELQHRVPAGPRAGRAQRDCARRAASP